MIERKKRIDLTIFDADWAKINNGQEDSYILVRTPGIEEVIGFESGMGKLIEKEDVNTKEVYNKMMKFIAGHFLGGMIYDSETKKCRALVKEDLGSFDVEILRYVISGLTGGISKKG